MIPVRQDPPSSAAFNRADPKLQCERQSKDTASQFDAALAEHEGASPDGVEEKVRQEDGSELVALPMGNMPTLMPAQGFAALAVLFAHQGHKSQAATVPDNQAGAMAQSALPELNFVAPKGQSVSIEMGSPEAETDALDLSPDVLTGLKAVSLVQAHGDADRSSTNKKAQDDLACLPIEEIHITHHFAPVQADPIRQITSSVVKALQGTDGPSQTPASSQMSDSPIKTLQVKLEPEDLGSVTLRMRLSGNQLSLRVDVAEASTLQMIRNEQDRLHKSLVRDDVQIEKLEIRAAASVSDLAPVSKSEETARHGSGSGLGGEGHSSPLPQGQQQHAKGEGPRRSMQENQPRDEASSLAPSGALSRGLYL